MSDQTQSYSAPEVVIQWGSGLSHMDRQRVNPYFAWRNDLFYESKCCKYFARTSIISKCKQLVCTNSKIELTTADCILQMNGIDVSNITALSFTNW